jgi:hypothetical protein
VRRLTFLRFASSGSLLLDAIVAFVHDSRFDAVGGMVRGSGFANLTEMV